MIKIKNKKVKGKNRQEAVIDLKQVNIPFNRNADKDGLFSMVAPCAVFEDMEGFEDGLENELKQEDYFIKLSKKKMDIIRDIIESAIFELEENKKEVDV